MKRPKIRPPQVSGTPEEERRWRVFSWPSALVIVSALIIRILYLDLKPVHSDEGVMGILTDKIWVEGFYPYDPTNFHGPLYFYWLQLSEVFFGRGIWGFRFVTALFSVGSVAVALNYKKLLGHSTFWAALLLAISPAFVFFTRYAGQEALFIFAQMTFVYYFFQFQDLGDKKSALGMILSVVALVALKETFFIFVGSWFIAVVCVSWSEKNISFLRAKVPILKTPGLAWKDWSELYAVGLLLLACLYTGFFQKPEAIWDMIQGLTAWAKTGSAHSGHEKSMWYWEELLWRYEWPLALGLMLSPVTFFFSQTRERVLILAGFGVWLAHTLIPYKTPWLIMSPMWMLAFSFGFLIQKLTSTSNRRGTYWVGILLGSGLLAQNLATSMELNFENYSKVGEPYVYVQTTKEFKRVMDLLTQKRQEHPEFTAARIAAMNEGAWPMPWTLEAFPNVQWSKPLSTDYRNLQALLIDDDQQTEVEKKLQRRYFRLPFQIRDAYRNGFAYLAFEDFKDFLKESNLPVVGPQMEGP